MKKIANASSSEYKGTRYRSKLEASCARLLEGSGMEWGYEVTRQVVWKGFKLDRVRAYKHAKGKGMTPMKPRQADITYTPDFTVRIPGGLAFIEAKGFPNDRYPMKRKMFLERLEEDVSGKWMFFEVNSVEEMRQTLRIIEKTQEEWKKQ